MENNTILNFISYSYVTAWEDTINSYPGFTENQPFCKSLFNDPINTIVGMGPDGPVILIQGKESLKRLEIGSSRFNLISPSKNEFYEAYEKILSEVNKDEDYRQAVKINSFDINIECEVVFEGINVQDIVGKRFLAPGLKRVEFPVAFLDIRFRIYESNERINTILMQPRSGNSNGLFLHVSFHYERKANSLFSRSELDSHFLECEANLTDKLIPSLIF